MTGNSEERSRLSHSLIAVSHDQSRPGAGAYPSHPRSVVSTILPGVLSATKSKLPSGLLDLIKLIWLEEGAEQYRV